MCFKLNVPLPTSRDKFMGFGYFKTPGLITLILIFLLGVCTGTALAGGPIHGARAAGMGTAFLAVADDPSAILHNPGGITEIEGTMFYGGFTALSIDSSYKDGAGNKEDTKPNIYLPPHLFLTHQLESSKITLGFGLHSPFGIGGREWPSDGLTRYVATEGGISTIAMNPTIAFKANPELSLAVGLDYLQAMSVNEMMMDQSAFTSPDGTFRIEGEGAGWGWNMGSLWQVTPAFRIGLAYRSGISADMDGDLTITGIAPALQASFGGESFETGADTTMEFPEIIGVGFAMDWSESWIFAFDAELVRWSSFDEIHTDFEMEVPAGGIVDGTAFPDWEDSLQIKLGFEHDLSDRTSLRGGYAFVQTFVPDKSLEAGNPDSDQHSFSFGYGYGKDRFQIDTFVMLSLFEDRTVDNTFQTGKFENQIAYTGLSLGYRF